MKLLLSLLLRNRDRYIKIRNITYRISMEPIPGRRLREDLAALPGKKRRESKEDIEYYGA